MKFSIKDFFSKCDQLPSFLRIWSHLLKKSLMENFIFCVVMVRGWSWIRWRENEKNDALHILDKKTEFFLVHRFLLTDWKWEHTNKYQYIPALVRKWECANQIITNLTDQCQVFSEILISTEVTVHNCFKKIYSGNLNA